MNKDEEKTMKRILNEHFQGEPALFKSRDLQIENCLFDNGESPLKESENITVINTTFGYKYPLWYGKGHSVKNSTFLELSRSGLWYTDDSIFENLEIYAPKEFRRCKNISLNNINFYDAQETLWTCDTVKMTSVRAKGDYFAKDSKNLEIDNFHLDGNYFADGGENIVIKNSVLNSKDAFWNCKNVTIENCEINGEYFGWNSINVTLRNCTIRSHQGFCYMKNLTLINCKIEDSDLIFEYCENISADINSKLDSVKNPISGEINCLGVNELIQDDKDIDLSKISINIKEGK